MAKLLQSEGYVVGGTVRKHEDMMQWRERGVMAFKWDSVTSQTMSESMAALDGCTYILSTVQVGLNGKDPVLDDLEIRNAIEKQKDANLKWVGYLSTTGVYGDHEGKEVDETSLPNPTSKRGAKRVAAEKEWMSIEGLPLFIFRLPGIYGPGRGPIEKLRNGTARRINKPNHVFCRIHVDDICGALLASMRQVGEKAASVDYPQVFNIVDDLPESASVVTLFASELLCVNPPKEEDYSTAEMTEMARSFYEESKRVANRKMHDVLKYELKYPTYKEGLVSQIEEESGMKLKQFQSRQQWLNKVYPIWLFLKREVVRILSAVIAIFSFIGVYLMNIRKEQSVVFLIDNGSIRPASTLNLRMIASKLSKRLDLQVEAVSCRWSDKVKASELEGIEAEILLPAIKQRKQKGSANNFILLPLFFGPR